MANNILIAPDKFKGSLTSEEVCLHIFNGLISHDSRLNIQMHPIADGGDGSIEILKKHLNAKEILVNTTDPLGRSIEATYIIASDIAYIELASASGMVLLDKNERNPMYTSTYGTGTMMLDAINRGMSKVVLLLGGSATNDAGLGIAAALGYDFIDKNGESILPIGKVLADIKKIIPSEKRLSIKLKILCDVDNPLYGFNGAAYIYGPQKGANETEVKLLDKGLEHIANLIKSDYQVDVQSIKGAGAAGGVASGLVGLFDAEINNGFDELSAMTNLEHKIKNADIVITGEGQLDRQSFQGKVVGKVSTLCKKYNKPLIVVTGNNTLTENESISQNINQVLSIMDIADNTQDAIQNAGRYLEVLAKNIMKSFY